MKLPFTEPWSYEVKGRKWDARMVWHCPPPGPKGCGIAYKEVRTEDVLAPDGVWERHVHEIKIVDLKGAS